jgi:hypothetical protein
MIKYRHNKVFIMTFIITVWVGIFSISTGLLPGPALYSGVGAAEKPQEIVLRIV